MRIANKPLLGDACTCPSQKNMKMSDRAWADPRPIILDSREYSTPYRATKAKTIDHPRLQASAMKDENQ